MTAENKQSLQKRPDLVPEQLMRGGLIVGVEQGIQGSLMSVTGAAIERITRERTEVPPQFKLPERAVYFLDPNTRRLIMISNRENRGENKTPDKYGLFAEIVELDEEGKPHYRLSTSEIILPNNNYQLVAVGPNKYGLPPSHIEVVEEGEVEFKGQGIFERGYEVRGKEAQKGKKRFVAWNSWLSTLQWTNEVRIDPNEDFETFIKRFFELRRSSMFEAQRMIEAVFPKGEQGISEQTAPVNMIITDGYNDLLRKASIDANLYPLLIDMKDLAEYYYTNYSGETDATIAAEEMMYSVGQYLPNRPNVYPAVITFDEGALKRIPEYSGKSPEIFKKYSLLRVLHGGLQKYNPIFSLVLIRDETPFEDSEMEKEYKKLELVDMPNKFTHGYYRSPYDEDQYRGLLNKLKADLLLTMFLRGGAPIVK